MMPSIFGEVIQLFPGGLPSDAAVVAKLRMDKGFASQEAATAFLRTLRASMAIAEGSAVDQDFSSEQNEGVPNGEEEPTVTPDPQIEAPLKTPGKQAPQSAPSGVPHAENRRWELVPGVVAALSISGKLTKKSVEKLKRYIDALANEAAIAWEDEGEST